MNPARAGSALLAVLCGILVLSALGLALVLLSTTETLSAGNARRAGAALYAADAGIERVLPDLLRAASWDAVLDGRLRSGFVDGPGSGTRILAGGQVLDLGEVVNLANCGTRAGCSAAAMNANTEGRPWGRNNPRWRLFAHGPLSLLQAGPSDHYVAVLVADDPAENDDDPGRDGRAASNPGAGLLLVRAEAFGPERAHRVIEATIARGLPASGPAGYAGQRGQGQAGDGGAGGSVQVPGGSLSRSQTTMDGGTTRQ